MVNDAKALEKKSRFRKRRQVRHGESVLWRTAALQSPESFRAKTFVSICSIRVFTDAKRRSNGVARLLFRQGRQPCAQFLHATVPDNVDATDRRLGLPRSRSCPILAQSC